MGNDVNDSRAKAQRTIDDMAAKNRLTILKGKIALWETLTPEETKEFSELQTRFATPSSDS